MLTLHVARHPCTLARMAAEAQKAARNLSQGMNMRGITSQPPSIKYLAAGFLVGIGGKYVYDVYYPARLEPEVQGVKDKVTEVQAETIKRLQVSVGTFCSEASGEAGLVPVSHSGLVSWAQ